MEDSDSKFYIQGITGRGFGDALFAIYLTEILNKNGIDAAFTDMFKRDYLYDRVADCLCARGESDFLGRKGYRCDYKYKPPGERDIPIMEQLIGNFNKRFNTSIKNNLNYIPVKYEDIPSIKGVDVVLGTKTGRFSVYRDWPYFDELKRELDNEGIRYIDMTKREIGFVDSLNYIKKSKLFIGLECGLSHYASSVANGKTLILQSGFQDFEFWCSYDYEHFVIDVPCRRCKCHWHSPHQCENDHKCMKDISVDQVFEWILRSLVKQKGSTTFKRRMKFAKKLENGGGVI